MIQKVVIAAKKKVVIAACFFVIALPCFAQRQMPDRPNTYNDESPETGFKKQNLFLGGSLSVGYSGYDFNVGGTPEIGYSLNRWVDAGLLVNLNYSSERADPELVYNDNTRYRTFDYGAGVFTRIYPLPFLFFQVEPEYNIINANAKDMNSGITYTATTQATSLLLGIGYGQRVIGHASFYIALLFDALSNPSSPYRDPFTNVALPIVRAGFDIYLHPNKQ
jgi:hypothetical protein